MVESREWRESAQGRSRSKIASNDTRMKQLQTSFTCVHKNGIRSLVLGVVCRSKECLKSYVCGCMKGRKVVHICSIGFLEVYYHVQ